MRDTTTSMRDTTTSMRDTTTTISGRGRQGQRHRSIG
jgi:hypothetical protein